MDIKDQINQIEIPEFKMTPQDLFTFAYCKATGDVQTFRSYWRKRYLNLIKASLYARAIDPVIDELIKGIETL